jgi:hypothetical protein
LLAVPGGEVIDSTYDLEINRLLAVPGGKVIDSTYDLETYGLLVESRVVGWCLHLRARQVWIDGLLAISQCPLASRQGTAKKSRNMFSLGNI